MVLIRLLFMAEAQGAINGFLLDTGLSESALALETQIIAARHGRLAR